MGFIKAILELLELAADLVRAERLTDGEAAGRFHFPVDCIRSMVRFRDAHGIELFDCAYRDAVPMLTLSQSPRED